MRVLLVPNRGNSGVTDAAANLAQWLAGQGLEPVLTIPDAEGIGLPIRGCDAADFGELSLVVAMGGDGTILRAAHLLGEVEVPILGVNFGKLGFLAGARPEHLMEAVTTALSGEARIERRATLRAEAIVDGQPQGELLVLNEAVVLRGRSGRVVALDLSIDGHRIMRTRADGMVVATATGSTAYALSAGGPVVGPSFGGMVVVPVAAHTLQSRAIVTDPSDVVEITFPDPARSEASLAVDGEIATYDGALECVIVRRSSTDVLLAKLEGRHFYETLHTEFFGS
jgi:NAD+ kinase